NGGPCVSHGPRDSYEAAARRQRSARMSRGSMPARGCAAPCYFRRMIELQRFGDVERVRLASLGSRIAGLDVSAYLVRGILVDSGFPRARGALAGFLTER